jgi:hypothetical protein
MISIFRRPSDAEARAAVDAWYAKQVQEEHVRQTGPSLFDAEEGYAQILIKWHFLPWIIPDVTVEWFGPASAPVRINEELLIAFRDHLPQGADRLSAVAAPED